MNFALKNLYDETFPYAYRDELFSATVTSSFMDESLALFRADLHLAALCDAFDREQLAMTLFCKRDAHEIIQLNVSGQSMEVRKTTLSLFPDSLLYKQCVNPHMDGLAKRKIEPPQEWTPVQVSEWIRSLGSSLDVSEMFADMNGKELLSLTRQDLKDLGIERPGTVALLAESIRKLRDEEVKNSVIVIEHSAYCIGKILDHMRLMSVAKLVAVALKPPYICEQEKEEFKSIVEYYFPTSEMASQFLG